jgi:hypothetical protein
MILAFDLSRYRRAKVWLGEHPTCKTPEVSVVENSVKPASGSPFGHDSAAVELYVPHGARSSYALVGAEFREADEDELRLIVAIGDERQRYSEGLVSSSEDVFVGLPDEYREAVVRGAIGALNEGDGPPRGVLRLEWAAHGHVSSSAAIFGTATAMLVKIMKLPRTCGRTEVQAIFE